MQHVKWQFIDKKIYAIPKLMVMSVQRYNDAGRRESEHKVVKIYKHQDASRMESELRELLSWLIVIRIYRFF